MQLLGVTLIRETGGSKALLNFLRLPQFKLKKPLSSGKRFFYAFFTLISSSLVKYRTVRSADSGNKRK
jgi:hypothetical protein